MGFLSEEYRKCSSDKDPIFIMKTLSWDQHSTIKDLQKFTKADTPIDVVAWCLQKMEQPKKKRKHGKSYYQDIIDYIAQGGKV